MAADGIAQFLAPQLGRELDDRLELGHILVADGTKPCLEAQQVAGTANANFGVLLGKRMDFRKCANVISRAL